MIDNQAISEKILAALFLIAGFILPPVLLYYDLVPPRYLAPLLGGVPLLCLSAYLMLFRPPLKDLGFSITLRSIKQILPMTLLILLGELFLFALIPLLLGAFRPLYLDLPNICRYTYVTLVQEIIWRGFAFVLLKEIFGRKGRLTVVTSALLFSFSHVYYRSITILAGSFLLGIFWGSSYWRHRSLIGPTISHYVLGIPIIVLNYMGIKTVWSLL